MAGRNRDCGQSRRTDLVWSPWTPEVLGDEGCGAFEDQWSVKVKSSDVIAVRQGHELGDLGGDALPDELEAAGVDHVVVGRTEHQQGRRHLAEIGAQLRPRLNL